MERPQAKKTAYVGQLADGKRLGYWLLVLTTPFRGRAIPFHLITYPANTISTQGTSRNQEHFRAVAAIKSLLGDRPLVLDWEFSCLELCHSPVTERIHFVIRLKIGLQQVSLLDHEVQPIKLVAQSGKSVIYLIEIL